eukprot:CCRYP_016917-RA/>CCRYP_016917-RA protein AED:0.45 eAED:0.65 QI:0/0/0/1/0/0/2/0/152
MIFQDDKEKGSALKKNYLYLDTCSTKDQMVIPKYLTDIHAVKDPLVLHTNAGKSKADKKGYLGGTPFWLDKRGIANVVSLKTLESKYQITYDSKVRGRAFPQRETSYLKDAPGQSSHTLIWTNTVLRRLQCWFRLSGRTLRDILGRRLNVQF